MLPIDHQFKGHYDPLTEFLKGQFAILEGHNTNFTTVVKACHNSYEGEPVIMRVCVCVCMCACMRVCVCVCVCVCVLQ